MEEPGAYRLHKVFDGPEAQIEGYYEKNGLFDHVRGIQAELDLRRFATYNEANSVAQDLIRELDGLARTEDLIGRLATLVGKEVMMPVTYHAKHGGVTVSPQPAYDDASKIKDVTGSFNGFCCYAAEETYDGRYRPVLGFSVRLRPVFTPGFEGTLTAYGPVESTFVDFLDDEVKREFSTNP